MDDFEFCRNFKSDFSKSSCFSVTWIKKDWWAIPEKNGLQTNRWARQTDGLTNMNSQDLPANAGVKKYKNNWQIKKKNELFKNQICIT